MKCIGGVAVAPFSGEAEPPHYLRPFGTCPTCGRWRIRVRKDGRVGSHDAIVNSMTNTNRRKSS